MPAEPEFAAIGLEGARRVPGVRIHPRPAPCDAAAIEGTSEGPGPSPGARAWCPAPPPDRGLFDRVKDPPLGSVHAFRTPPRRAALASRAAGVPGRRGRDAV